MNTKLIIKTLILIMSAGMSSIETSIAQHQKGKMYFSTQPFAGNHDGDKAAFSSADHIYGRIETDQQPLKQAFNMASIKTQPLYLQATYKITRDDGREKFMQGSIFLRMDGGAEDKSSFNFDIMPNSNQVNTTVSVVDDFNTGYRAGFFLPFQDNTDYFWKNGEYKVEISLYLKSYNAWGSLEDTEKWPDITGMFMFRFDEKDVAAQISNSEAGMEAVKQNSIKMEKLPDYFHRPAKIDDPNLAPAKVMAILKRDLPQLKVIKMVIPAFDGPLKDIARNDLGVILYRYVRPYIRVVYTENGKCYLGSVSLKEDYMGGGKYGPLKYNKFWGGEGLLDCSQVK